MRILILILLVLPVVLMAQKKPKKVEKETNKCIEAYTKSNGVEWGQIQDYFENYLYLSSIQKKDESIETGYLNYIQLRKNVRLIPPMPKREEFKAQLVKAGILDQSANLIGQPLNKCFADKYKKYNEQLPKKSTFVGIAEMLAAIEKVGDISPTLIAGGLEVAFKENGISHPLYKKVIILSLFIDAIYLDEIRSRQISKENPLKKDLKRAELSKEEAIMIVDDDVEIDEDLTIEIVDVPTEAEEEQEEEIFLIVEKMPKFPGGQIAMHKYIAKNIIYPKDAKENGIEGKVYIRFCITKSGNVDKVSVARGIDSQLDKEAVRVIKSFPAWTPGEQRGKKVNVWFTIPVMFSLN